MDAALHYLARMIEAGEDPRFIARRLMISASEDIGLADPHRAADRGRRRPGGGADRLPGGVAITLSQAVIALALAPKSNAAITGRSAPRSPTSARGWPARCRRTCATATTRARPSSATPRATSYPHDLPGAIAAQQYAPDAVHGRRYYEPTRYGAEARYADVLDRVRERLSGR